MRSKPVVVFTLFTFAMSAAVALAGANQPVIYLWPNGAPGFENRKDEKEIEKKDAKELNVSNVHNPSITVFAPPKDKATRLAMIVIPGGGHSNLTMYNSGYNPAKLFSDQGITCFVLKYRLGRGKGTPYKIEEHAVQDVQRAIRLVRSRAHEWNIDPDKLGIMGFSAGGELVGMAANRFDKGNPDAADPVERQSCRPAFQAMIYTGPLAEVPIAKDSPPAFICVGFDDNFSINAANIFLKMKKAGIPAEFHTYTNIGHGFGVNDVPHPVVTWPNRFEEWLVDMGFWKRG